MNFQLTTDFIRRLELLINNNDSKAILNHCADLLAPDIAEIITNLKFKDAKFLFDLYSEEMSADILIELEDDFREKLLDTLSSKEIVEEVIENLDSDDAADVIQELSHEKQKEVLLNIVNPQQASDLADLLSYDENSAGALMAKELIQVREKWSILRCVSEMREQAQNVNKVYTIYVINKQNQLLGTVSLKQLLLTPEKTFIGEIFNTNIISVTTNTSGEDVARIMNKYDLVVLPVVNKTTN